MMTNDTFQHDLTAAGITCVHGSAEEIAAAMKQAPASRCVTVNAEADDLDGCMRSILRSGPGIVAIVR